MGGGFDGVKTDGKRRVDGRALLLCMWGGVLHVSLVRVRRLPPCRAALFFCFLEIFIFCSEMSFAHYLVCLSKDRQIHSTSYVSSESYLCRYCSRFLLPSRGFAEQRVLLLHSGRVHARASCT